nr:LAGLIDADG endonuclease [Orbilia oligospora]QBL01994.1 LAGLIDADG endonuclease [Orbilia oligospora]
MVGLIISNAWIKFSSKTSQNTLLGFTQSNVNSKYFWFVFFSLSHYCSSYPLIKIKNPLGTNTIELQFETRSMPCITELYSLFYSEKIKVIPQNIYNLLTLVA